MAECADPFTPGSSDFLCDYTEPVGQIGRALRAPENDIPQIKQVLHGFFPSRILPQAREDRPPGQCAKFTIASMIFFSN
jgi:hypothetical protein